MRKKVNLLVVILLLSAFLPLIGCVDRLSGSVTESDSIELLTPEAIESIFSAISHEVDEKYPTETAEDGHLIVYWLEGGSVWHISSACSSVAKADQSKISYGSVNDAVNAGKERGCKVCAKDTMPESITVDLPDIENVVTSVSEESVTEKIPIDHDVSSNIVVCWLEGSKVWHLSKQCSSLSRTDPDNLIFGTVDEALSAGKERACKTCSE